MKKIRIAQVVTRLDWGGVPEIVRTICHGLDPDQFEITLVIGRTAHPSNKTRAFLETWHKRTVYIPEMVRAINPWLDAIAFFKLWRLFRNKKFDIVHTHTSKAGALGRLAAKCAKIPGIIHTSHGHIFYGYFSTPASRLLILAERFFSSFTDAITAFTVLEKKDFLDYKVAKPEAIRVIYQGLDLTGDYAASTNTATIKKRYNIQERERIVGMIGRLDPIKDPCTFVRAAAQVCAQIPDTKFILVGEGSLRPQIERLIADLGLQDRFILTGWLEESREIMGIFEIMVLCSLNEAVGIVLIEAQSQGIPVVATRVGGIPEVVNDGVTGLLIDPQDPAQLAVALCTLLNDQDARTRLGRAAQTWIADKFCARAMLQKITELYLELSPNHKDPQ